MYTKRPNFNNFGRFFMSKNKKIRVHPKLKKGSPDKPGGLSIQLCKSEKKEFYIRYSS